MIEDVISSDGELVGSELLTLKSDLLALKSDLKLAFEIQTLKLTLRLGSIFIAGLVIEALMLMPYLAPP